MTETGSDPTVIRPVGRSTIDDVARVAGVSRQTVSNVIRGRGRLAPATRVRVERTIEDLRYSPHPGASSLRSRRTHQLAHVLPSSEFDPTNIIVLEFIRALVRSAADSAHHILLVAETSRPSQIEALMDSGRVDGFVFSALRRADPRVALAAARGVPFACFGRTDPTLPQHWVDIDNAGGIITAVKHLVAKGHRRIAYLGMDDDNYWESDRLQGYRTAMDAAGLTIQTIRSRAEPHDLPAAALALLDVADLPTAVIASGDQATAALYRAAQARHLTIGADLDVVGFEGGAIGRTLHPPLTSVDIPVEEIAALVVARVLAEINGPQTDQPGKLLPLQITRGESA